LQVTKEDVSDRVTVLLTLSYGGELLAETLIHSGLCNSIPASGNCFTPKIFSKKVPNRKFRKFHRFCKFFGEV